MASSHFTDGRFHIFLETASQLAEAKVPERFPWSLLVEGARGAHSFGYSWAEIAQEIGVTRQAAWERFSKRKGEEDGQPVGNATRD